MTGPGTSSIDDIIASATPSEREAKVCVAGALNARFAALAAELSDIQAQRIVATSLSDVDPRRAIAEQMEDLRSQMREHEHTFTMRALAPEAWSNLRAAHAPKNAGERFDVDTFPSALVAAACVKVDGANADVTVEKVNALFAVLNEGQRDELFNAAWEANTGAVSVPFSVLASAVLATSATS